MHACMHDSHPPTCSPACTRPPGRLPAGSGKQLGMQVLGVLVIAAWSCVLTGVLFFGLRKVGAAQAFSFWPGLATQLHGWHLAGLAP